MRVMNIREINAILILLLVIMVIIRNWLIVNAIRVSKGLKKKTIIEAYNETIYTIKPFLIIIKRSNSTNEKVRLLYFYSNIIVVIIYSILLNIIFNFILAS